MPKIPKVKMPKAKMPKVKVKGGMKLMNTIGELVSIRNK